MSYEILLDAIVLMVLLFIGVPAPLCFAAAALLLSLRHLPVTASTDADDRSHHS